MWLDIVFDKLITLAIGIQIIVFVAVVLTGFWNTYKDWKRKNTHV